MNEIYKIPNPLFVPITTMSIPISVVVCLLYAYNWICGSIQALIMISLYEFDICYIPWSWALDKSMFIGLGFSTASCLILVIYYLEYFHRKIIYLKILAEQDRNNMKSTMDQLPAPIVISTQGKIAYSNESFDKINHDIGEQNHLAINVSPEVPTIQKINHPQNMNPDPEELNSIYDNEYNKVEENLEKFSSSNDHCTLKHAILEGKPLVEEEFVSSINKDSTNCFSVSSLKITIIDKICNLYIMKNLTEIYKIKALNEREKFQRIYVASLTHDFRSPINIIMVLAEVLLEIIDDPLIKKYILNIFNASSILAFLVQDVLDYSQLKSGTLDLAINPFLIQNEFGIIISLFEEKYKNKRLYLNLVISENVPKTIINDSNRIKQVLMNLLGNAFKFTQNGGVTINVNSNLSDNLVIVEVRDTGVGMNEEEIQQLFQEYGKIERHKDLNPMGIGLGLFICKQLIEKMGGKISVKSEINQGTVFTFSFLITISDNVISPLNANNFEEDKNQINSCERLDSEMSLKDHCIPKSFKPPESFRITDVKILNCSNCPKVLLVDDD